MKIVREQREENNSLLRVTVGEEDYGQAVEKELREYKRKANIPGFRPGMVPMGLVKKMYGKGVLAEQSYRTASNAVFEYLQKEKIDYLGDVIPSEEQGDFDFENGKEFDFVFEIGEAPEIKLDLSDKDKVTYHKIKVDKKMHDDYRANYLRRFGRLVDADEVTSDEALSVTLDNGEMNVADAYVGLISMSQAVHRQEGGLQDHGQRQRTLQEPVAACCRAAGQGGRVGGHQPRILAGDHQDPQVRRTGAERGVLQDGLPRRRGYRRGRAG